MMRSMEARRPRGRRERRDGVARSSPTLWTALSHRELRPDHRCRGTRAHTGRPLGYRRAVEGRPAGGDHGGDSAPLVAGAFDLGPVRRIPLEAGGAHPDLQAPKPGGQAGERWPRAVLVPPRARAPLAVLVAAGRGRRRAMTVTPSYGRTTGCSYGTSRRPPAQPRARDSAEPGAGQERGRVRAQGLSMTRGEGTPSVAGPEVRSGRLDPTSVEQTAAWIASVQLPNGMVPWYPGGHADPWNHIEAAMALSVAGRRTEGRAGLRLAGAGPARRRRPGAATTWRKASRTPVATRTSLPTSRPACGATTCNFEDPGFLETMWPVVEVGDGVRAAAAGARW